MYATLLERYNPGMNMDDEERIKMTARRVGMEMPEEYELGGEGNGNGGKKE
jgi:ATP synthase assembly factor FMC1